MLFTEHEQSTLEKARGLASHPVPLVRVGTASIAELGLRAQSTDQSSWQGILLAFCT